MDFTRWTSPKVQLFQQDIPALPALPTPTSPSRPLSPTFGELGPSRRLSAHDLWDSAGTQQSSLASLLFWSNISHLLAEATHESLLQSGNRQYAELYHGYIKIQSELHTLKYTYTTLASQAATREPSPPLKNTLNALPSSASSITPLDQKQYPKVQFWRRITWEQSKLNKDITTIDGDGTSAKKNTLLYIEDVNGVPIDGPRAMEVRKRAREIFLQFKKAGTGTKTWTQLDFTSLQYYRAEMSTQFPELRLCEQDWKADKVAIDTYSGWYRNQTKAKDGKAVKQEDTDKKSSSKRPLPSNAPKSDQCAKKIKLLPDTPVVLLTLQPSPDVRMTGEAPLSLLSNAPLSPFLEAPLSPLSIAPLSPLSEAPLLPLSPLSIAPISPLSEVPLLPLSPLSIAPISPLSEVPLSPLCSQALQTTGTVLNPTSSATDQSTIVPLAPIILEEATQAEAEETQEQISPATKVFALVDPLANIFPGPKATVVSRLAGIEMEANKSSSKSLSMAKLPAISKTKADAPVATDKKPQGKKMRPNPKSTTARNLYAIDYIKDHPHTTTAEFTAIWDILNKETKDAYEKLSLSRKLLVIS